MQLEVSSISFHFTADDGMEYERRLRVQDLNDVSWWYYSGFQDKMILCSPEFSAELEVIYQTMKASFMRPLDP